MLRSLQPPTHRRRTIGALAAIGAVLATALVDVQPASAGALCDRLGLCGEAINHTDTSMTIAEFKGRKTCRVEGGSLRCTTKTLPAGEDAGDGRGYFKDVDGLTFITTGYYVRTSPNRERFIPRGTYIKLYDTHRVTCTQAGPVAAPRCSFG